MYIYKAKCRRVIDGDTLVLDIDLGMGISYRTKVRLLGINAPEIHGVSKSSQEYKLGMDAKNFIEENIQEKDLIIKTHKDRRGKYGRYLAEIFVDGVSINQLMLDKGYAVIPPYVKRNVL